MHVFSTFSLPQINDVVFMVSSIKINISRIHKQESKQYEQNLYGVFASVHIVSIENVGFLHWRHSILGQ